MIDAGDKIDIEALRTQASDSAEPVPVTRRWLLTVLTELEQARTMLCGGLLDHERHLGAKS